VPDFPTLPNLLLALRKRAGINQTAAAVHADVAPETWRHVERGERSPTAAELVRIMAACEATDDERGAIAAAALADDSGGES